MNLDDDPNKLLTDPPPGRAMISQEDDRDYGDDAPPGRDPYLRHEFGFDWFYWQGSWYLWDKLPLDGKRFHHWHREEHENYC